MKEIVMTIFVAEDGTKFTDRQDCFNYERKRKEIESLKRALERIRDICDKTDCSKCPFVNGTCCGITNRTITDNANFFPQDWDNIKDWGKQ